MFTVLRGKSAFSLNFRVRYGIIAKNEAEADMDEREKLFGLQDVDFKLFSQKLIPTVDENRVIGVRTPDIKALAREIYGSGEYAGFISALPHYYYEENNLHGFIICEIKDFDTSIFEIERFLPFVDNWATCDGLRPKAFNRNRDRLLPYIKKWIKSKHTYTVRFGIGMLMCHFLDEDFRPEYLSLAAGVVSDEYYINMMLAWYFATALTKRYGETLPYLERQLLPDGVHDRAIRKACESFRVSGERKNYLKSLKR